MRDWIAELPEPADLPNQRLRIGFPSIGRSGINPGRLRNRLVYNLIIGFGLGLAAAEYGDWLWACILLSGLTAAVLGLRRTEDSPLLLALIAGFLYWMAVHPLEPAVFQDGERYHGKAQIVSRPASREGRTRMIVRLQSVHPQVMAECSVPENEKLLRGVTLYVNGTVSPISGVRNFGDFDYREMQWHRGIFYRFQADRFAGLRILAVQPRTLSYLPDRAAQRGKLAFESYLTHREARLLNGMVLGTSGDMAAEDLALFQQTGLIHLLSASGFHVGFLMLAGVWMANRAGWRKWKRFGLIGVILIMYGSLTGWPLPMIRAVVMALFVLSAEMAGRAASSGAALAWAALLILIVSPGALFEISFRLTFLATAGIVWLAPALRPLLPDGKMFDTLALSLGPQLAVLPAALHDFGMLSVVSVLANLLILPLAGPAVILGFSAILLAQIHPALAFPLAPSAGFLSEVLFQATGIAAALPKAYCWTAQPSWWSVGLAYTALVVFITGSWSMKIRWISSAVFAAFFLFLLIPGSWRDFGELRVTFLDVGQGDCALIKTPEGRTVLIDGGGSLNYPIGEKTVLPYLRRQGINHLDLAVLSHAHADHWLGLREVLAEIPADGLVAPKRLKTFAGGRQIVVVHGSRSVQLDDETVMRFWSVDNGSDQENENALIAWVGTRKTGFLFTGDVGAEALDRMAGRLAGSVRTDVLKVSHHGSRYAWSDRLVRTLRPEIAVISVGKNNRFGHPSDETLGGLRRRKVRTYRTDLDGAVMVRSRDEGVKISTVRESPDG
ncbi:MAG: DNA internalization-related competence protein ComEC/Rec2 [Solirubrobacterales bacterium]